MKAAVVTAWGDTPRYEDYPEPANERGAVVEVLAAALHHDGGAGPFVARVC